MRKLTLGVTSQPPAVFRLGKYLIRRRVRGGWRLLTLAMAWEKMLQRFGRLRAVTFAINDSLKIDVPLGRLPIDAVDLSEYESSFLATLTDCISRLPREIIVIDCGADIGIFSLKTLSTCASIQSIVAFEPNNEGFVWLQRNLGRLPLAVYPRKQAVSDFSGHGRLCRPSGGDYAAQYLESAPDGPINVTTIDSLSLPPGQNVVLKLDLEGGELAALRGAARTVKAADNIVIAIEAHPEVAKRTCVDPVECLRLLSTWRQFEFVAGETGTPIKTDRAIFDQLPSVVDKRVKVYNIIAATPVQGTSRKSAA